MVKSLTGIGLAVIIGKDIGEVRNFGGWFRNPGRYLWARTSMAASRLSGSLRYVGLPVLSIIPLLYTI
jgi:hypothetical protein